MKPSETAPRTIWSERIRCPKCARVQMAVVKFPIGYPSAVYIKVCICGYIITESEWEKAC